MHPAHTLLCTVGTSLLRHLAVEPEASELPAAARAFARGDLKAVVQMLAGLDPADRRLGAEINSVAELWDRGRITSDARIELFHSATDEGRSVAEVLGHYFQARGHETRRVEVEHLQDAQPRLFKSKGLRNLAKVLCQSVRRWGTAATAIDATGGYKAQIAVAVLIGQALGLPVYYKHERFSEIIDFPPMPVSLDLGLWMRWSGLLLALDRNELVPWSQVERDWEPALETLIDRVPVEGEAYLDLSYMGQIFLESLRDRFARGREAMLPPPAEPSRKQPVRLTGHNWGGARAAVQRFLERVVEEVPYVVRCRDHYWNPDLPSAPMFRLRGDRIEGVYSDGTWTVKFWVDTTATHPGQIEACVADLNGRLEGWIR